MCCEKQIDYKYNKLLNVHYGAFMGGSHFCIISVNEYHEQIQDYTYTVV